MNEDKFNIKDIIAAILCLIIGAICFMITCKFLSWLIYLIIK